MKHFLKRLLLFFLVMIAIKSNAQQKHFIYVETEDRQPFAVVLNGKVFSSSDYGYVIIPKLEDGAYNFTVSFPMNKFPDQQFKCNINKKDVGFKLENSAGKGWALQNLQTQKYLSGSGESTADNAFTDMLSDVANDSTLTKKNIPVTASKQDTVAITPTHVTIDTTSASTPASTNTNFSVNTSTTINANTPPQKISETKLDTGTNMVFVDKSNGADTIHVFVPAENNANSNQSASTSDSNLTQQQNNVTVNNNAQTSSATNTDSTSHNSSNPFYKPDNTAASSSNNSSPTTTKPIATSAVKQDCANTISDNDMDKIKRKMFVQKTDNDMVQTALHYTNDKCITTDQVAVLGGLFSSDDGRYMLFDALYKRVYDYGNYASLEHQMIDPYYKKRFEAMLR